MEYILTVKRFLKLRVCSVYCLVALLRWEMTQKIPHGNHTVWPQRANVAVPLDFTRGFGNDNSKMARKWRSEQTVWNWKSWCRSSSFKSTRSRSRGCRHNEPKLAVGVRVCECQLSNVSTSDHCLYKIASKLWTQS